MKNLKKFLAVVLAAGMVASFAVTANADPYAIMDGDYSQVNGNKYVTAVEYFDSEGVMFSKRVIENNENHQASVITCYQYDDGVAVITDKYYYSYNENGKISELLGSKFEGQQEINNSKETFAYNQNGDPTSYKSYDWDDGEYLLDSEEVYTYNQDGTLASEDEKRYDTQTGNVDDEEFTSYKYDARGRVIEDIEVDNGINFKKHEYTYCDQGVLTNTTYFWDGSDWYKSYRKTSTYSEDGLTVTEEEYGWTGADFDVFHDKYVYIKDANGNTLSRTHYDEFDGQNYEPCCREDYTYDEFGNLLKYIDSSWEHGEWEATYSEVYTYGTYEVPTSPKTGDVAPIAIALTSVIALGALVISKKVNA